jgi:MFS family permease
MGMLLAVIPFGLGIVAPISGTWSDKIGPRPVLVIGLVIMLIGFAGLTTLTTDTSTLRYMLLTLPVGIGIGIFQTPNNSAVMGSVPPERLGVTSGMLTITRITGQITGIAVLGTLWSGRVAARSGLTDPTEASGADQVAGLTDTTMVVVVLVIVALVMAVWSLRRDRTENTTTS